MFLTPQSIKQSELNSQELVILKSLALGLGCDTIKNLLDFSELEFEKKLSSLYRKLQVCNAYTAVGAAFRKRILNEKDFTSEKSKSIALEFATQNVHRLKTVSEDSNKLLWNTYDLLIDFLLYMDKQNRKEVLK